MGDQIHFDFNVGATVTPRGDGTYIVKPGPPRPRGMMDVNEVAKRLSVTGRHILDLIEEGKLVAVDIGGGTRKYWRVKEEDLQAFLRKRSSLS